jgi:small-conductance mechanosensitive channel
MTAATPTRRLCRIGAGCLLAVLALSAPASGAAQTQWLVEGAAKHTANKPAAGSMSPQEARDVVSRLSDSEVRELLIAQLASGERRPVEVAKPDFTERFRAASARVGQRIRGMFAKADRLPQLPALVWSNVTVGGTANGGRILAVIAGLLALGFVAEWLFRRMLVVLHARDREQLPEKVASRLGLVALRTVVDLLGLAVFALVPLALVLVLDPANQDAVLLFETLLGGLVAFRLVALGSRTVLAPRTPALRTVPLGDAAARGLHRRLLALAALVIINRMIRTLLNGYAIDEELTYLVKILDSGVLVLVLIGMIWQARRPIAAFIGGAQPPGESEASSVRQALAHNWHALAIVYVVLIWLMAIGVALATGVDTLALGIISLLIVVALPLADAGLVRLAAHFFGAERRSARAEAAGGTVPAVSLAEPTAAEGSRPSYEAVALRNLRILLAVLVLAVFTELWHIDVEGLAQAVVGERFARALFDITTTLLLAYAVWAIVKTAVERYTHGEAPGPATGPEGEGGGTGASRAQTLLPLFRKFMFATLVAVGVMIVLSSLGVNIGPLLAGAGVVGIAIGFGAQTLVRDIVSGMFFLMDDAFRVGEYVDVGDIQGTVEKISIRSMQLRHYSGLVHTVPFGEIRHLTNWSRDWAQMRFEIRVPFETDIDKVRKIIKKVGKEMMADPEFGPLMLSPLKSQGVNKMDDSALIVRCKFMSIPGEQFALRRQAYNRIQRAFAEEGINFAPRRVLVEATGSAVAGAAAAGALDRSEDKASNPNDEPG